jgi:HD-like signal output (HDOD) protein
LLEHWNFPPLLVESVRFHHEPHRAGLFPVGASLVHVADVVAHASELGSSGESVVPRLDGSAWNQLGIEIASLGALVDELDRQFDDAIALFL